MTLSHLHKIKNSSFQHVSEYIQNPDIIQETKQMLDEQNISISPKVILSSYIIHICPDDILSSERSPIEETLYVKSRELIESLEDENIFDIQDICTQYNNVFETWKKKDKESQLSIYLDLYDNYQKMEQTEETIEIKNKLYAAIHMFAKENTDSLIQEYTQTHETRTVQASLVLQIEKQIKEMYWKEKRELQTISNDQIVEWITDAKLLFVKIYDRLSYAETEKNELESILDISFIKSQLDENCYSINNLLHWIVDKLKLLDSPEFDSHYPAVHQSIDHSTNDSYVTVVKFILEHLEIIYDKLVIINNNE